MKSCHFILGKCYWLGRSAGEITGSLSSYSQWPAIPVSFVGAWDHDTVTLLIPAARVAQFILPKFLEQLAKIWKIQQISTHFWDFLHPFTLIAMENGPFEDVFHGNSAFSWAGWEEAEPENNAVPERFRTQSLKGKETPTDDERSESRSPEREQRLDHLAILMDDADVPLASLVSSQDPDPEVLQGSPSPSRARAPESSQSPTGGLEWLEDSAFPRKLKLKLRKLRYSPGAELRQSSTSRVQAGSLEMRSRSSIPMFPSTGRPVVKGKVGGGYESSLGALRRVRKKKYNFPDADEVVSLRAWHESTERIQSSWKEHSAEAERGVPFLDLVPVIGGSGCRGQNAVNMPFGHIAKERFEYNEFEETNKEFQASVVPRPKTQPARPGTRMIGKMRRPLIQIKEDFMSITSITSFHRLCKVQR